MQYAYLDRLPDINNCQLVTWEDISLAARRYIEEEYILPYQYDYPWLHEAWFDVPVKVRVGRYLESGYAGWFWYGNVGFSFAYEKDRHAVYHELAHHYTYGRIHPRGRSGRQALDIVAVALPDRLQKDGSGALAISANRSQAALPGWAIEGYDPVEDAEYLHEDIYAVID